jgi:hypothetical protein
MTTLREAAQQALERLMLHHRTWDARDDLNAITALKAALEQPEQPCNCRWVGDVQTQQCTLHEAHVDAIHEWAERAKAAEAKLAALEQPEPPPEAQTEAEKIAYCAGWWAAMEQKREQPEQEPVAWRYQNSNTEREYLVWNKGTGGRNWTPLYTHPPRREWRGLTEKEVNALWASHDKTGEQITRAIEAALKERNV